MMPIAGVELRSKLQPSKNDGDQEMTTLQRSVTATQILCLVS